MFSEVLGNLFRFYVKFGERVELFFRIIEINKQAGQKNSEEILLKKQDILAVFGELAVRFDDFDEILTEACRLVGEALGTDLAKVMELQEDGLTLLVRAGVGWKPGVVGAVTVKATMGSSEGHALQTGKPVASNDIISETRFEYADFIKDNGVRALVNVAIGSRAEDRPYGILEVDSRTPQDFGEREISFLRGYANLLAAAVDRLKVADQLQQAQSDLRKHEAAISQTNRLEAIGQLTGGVAHDFNNLLMVIGSAAHFLTKANISDERRAHYAATIVETVERASKLTGQLLSFARRQTLAPEIINVGERMTVVLDLLRPILGGGIKVEEDYCDPPCFVLADASQFETAIVNLAVNARDAMEGGGTLSFAVEATSGIPATRGHEIIPGHFIRISVTDTGSGIEADTLANIFDPFFTTKEVGKGTGLGLSQAFGFAKQSKGDIDVSSEAGIGSTFSLYLPQCRMTGPPFVHSEHRHDDASVPSVEDERVSGPRILIVEDNENVGQLAVEMLQELGYHTTYALNASLALKQLADSPEPFDLVFSDVMMPGMNGIELGEEIRRSNPSLPVILTSGYSDVLAQEGSHGFKLIAKPYSISALAKVLDMVLSSDREPNS